MCVFILYAFLPAAAVFNSPCDLERLSDAVHAELVVMGDLFLSAPGWAWFATRPHLYLFCYTFSGACIFYASESTPIFGVAIAQDFSITSWNERGARLGCQSSRFGGSSLLFPSLPLEADSILNISSLASWRPARCALVQIQDFVEKWCMGWADGPCGVPHTTYTLCVVLCFGVGVSAMHVCWSSLAELAANCLRLWFPACYHISTWMPVHTFRRQSCWIEISVSCKEKH